MKTAKGTVLKGDLIIRYVRPLVDPTRPGPNTNFSFEQIHNMAH